LFSVTTHVQPKIYQNLILFDRRVRRSGSQDILAFNRHTGKLEWTWDEYYRKARGLSGSPIYQGEKMFFTTERAVFAINILTGESI